MPEILIVDVGGTQILMLWVDPFITVADLADKASAAAGVEQYQLLSPTGSRLRRSCTLQDYAIRDGTVFTAIAPVAQTKVFGSMSAFAAVKKRRRGNHMG